jgi:hypothetical protein
LRVSVGWSVGRDAIQTTGSLFCNYFCLGKIDRKISPQCWRKLDPKWFEKVKNELFAGEICY